MEVEVRHDEESRRITYVMTGVLDLAQIGKTAQDRPADFDWSWSFLWDMRGVVGEGASSQSLRALRNQLAALWPPGVVHGRTAALVKRDLDYGLIRMFEGLIADLPRELRVFRDEAEALTWLAESKP